MKNRILSLNKNCLLRSKVEKLENFEQSYFNDTYEKAFKALKDITNNRYLNNQNKEFNDANNIIAFTGDRGSGKTSTMKSFKEALEGKNTEFIHKNYNIDSNKSFLSINTIDPTLFSTKESLVEIVIASMFQKFKSYKGERNLTDRQNLIRLFEVVYKDLESINTSKGDKFKSSEDNLENLMGLASVSTLRDNIHKLVDEYLAFLSDCRGNNNIYLVIPIDDLDMHLEVGEKMIEDIRKYLIQDNIIILLAVKFEQLEEVIEQKFLRELQENYKFYKILSNKDDKLRAFSNEIDIKVRRYVDKLIPYNRRCSISTINLDEINVEFDDDRFDKIKKFIEKDKGRV